MPKYAGAAATAYNLIARKGAPVAFTRETTAAFNPVTQQETKSTITFTLNGVAVPPDKSAEFRIGSLAKRNLVELHLAPNLGVSPQPGDKARWAGADWTVIWSNALDPAADGSPYALAYLER